MNVGVVGLPVDDLQWAIKACHRVIRLDTNWSKIPVDWTVYRGIVWLIYVNKLMIWELLDPMKLHLSLYYKQTNTSQSSPILCNTIFHFISYISIIFYDINYFIFHFILYISIILYDIDFFIFHFIQYILIIFYDIDYFIFHFIQYISIIFYDMNYFIFHF